MGDIVKYNDEMKVMIARQAVLQVTNTEYKKEVEDLVDELLESNSEMKQFRADRKCKDSSLYSKIDNIKEEVNTYYHGRNYPGPEGTSF